MGNTLKKANNKGFTLAELAIVIIVVGILAAVTIVGYGAWQKRIAENAVKSDLTAAASAMETARNFNDTGYPSSIPASFKASDNVILTYGGGDAKEFCIRGQTSKDSTISFYVSSANNSSIQSGNCPAYVPPAPPTPSIAAVNVTGATASMSWSAVTGATGYETQYRLSDGTWSASKARTALNDSYTLPTASRLYEFRVRAMNTTVASNWSNVVQRVYIPTPTIASITGEGCSGYVTESYAAGVLNFASAPNSIAESYYIDGYTPSTGRTVINTNTAAGTMSEVGYSTLWSYTSSGSGTFYVTGQGANGEKSLPASFGSRTYAAYDC